jgi:hypothetical protein
MIEKLNRPVIQKWGWSGNKAKTIHLKFESELSNQSCRIVNSSPCPICPCAEKPYHRQVAFWEDFWAAKAGVGDATRRTVDNRCCQ